MLKVIFYNTEDNLNCIARRVEKRYEATRNMLNLNIFFDSSDVTYDLLFTFFSNTNNDIYNVQVLNEDELLYESTGLTLNLIEESHTYSDNLISTDLRLEFIQEDSLDKEDMDIEIHMPEEDTENIEE